MLPQIAALEPRLKEILYSCLEEIRATKAALYLVPTADVDENTFELVTHYGFSDQIDKLIKSTDPRVERLMVRRLPYYNNGISADPSFSEILFAHGTDRILVAPVYARGRLVGILDMRDRAAKKPYDDGDIERAKQIAERIVDVLRGEKLFHLAAIELTPESRQNEFQNVVVQMRGRGAPQPEPYRSPLARPVPVAPAPETRTASTSFRNVIDAARGVVSRDIAFEQWNPEPLTESELSAVRQFLPVILLLENAVATAFTAWGHANNLQLIAARAPLSDAATQAINAKITAWMRKHAGGCDGTPRTEIEYPFGTAKAPIMPSGVPSVLSAPVTAAKHRGLVLSVAFSSVASTETKHNLEILLTQLEQTILHSISHVTLRRTRRAVAEALIEPDFERRSDLAGHAAAVTELAEQFCAWLALTPDEAETVVLAAMVQNAGMRLLDPLYKKRNPTPDEVQILHQHTVVGAALVAPLLGREVASIVLTHHERVDGRGYPGGISGEQIPLAARMIQLCDAFVSMTTEIVHTGTGSKAAAIESIRRGAGSEFDAALAEQFCAMIASQ
ncbi:MAG: HD domain-containing phosphohydrolase [Thermoanaerobaculia bacterium]